LYTEDGIEGIGVPAFSGKLIATVETDVTS
jgi:hypothetical protein